MKFEEASEKVKELKSVSDKDKLLFYRYFKQATVGDCNVSKPWEY